MIDEVRFGPPERFAQAGEFRFAEPPEPWPQLPALAERLGVKPDDGAQGTEHRTYLVMKDGRRYDLFELINAFLDRMDGATHDDR